MKKSGVEKFEVRSQEKGKSRFLAALGMTLFILASGFWLLTPSSAQQREVPGDRMRLDSFAHDRATNTLRWTVTLGSLDEQGQYVEAGKPVECVVEFSEYRATCEGALIEFGPVPYANLVQEMSGLMDHAYKLADIVRQERQDGRASR